jgi:hypothetical protein
MSDLDRGFLTGFFEGEATFAITEQNGGGSYSCSASVRLRDDDQDLLEWLVALTGLGSLHRVPAQGTSRPQIGWKIDSQADCAELIRLIGACGFHGRRAAELALWTQAVDAWTSTAGDDRRERLGSLKARLQASRRFGRGASAARPFAGTTNLTLGYISGLVCAEGCLHVNNLRPGTLWRGSSAADMPPWKRPDSRSGPPAGVRRCGAATPRQGLARLIVGRS